MLYRQVTFDPFSSMSAWSISLVRPDLNQYYFRTIAQEPTFCLIHFQFQAFLIHVHESVLYAIFEPSLVNKTYYFYVIIHYMNDCLYFFIIILPNSCWTCCYLLFYTWCLVNKFRNFNKWFYVSWLANIDSKTHRVLQI